MWRIETVNGISVTFLPTEIKSERNMGMRGLAKGGKERKWYENRLLIDSMLANGLINHSRTEENWKRNWNVYTYRATNEFQLKIYLFHKMEKWVIDWNRTGYNIEIWITHITHIHKHIEFAANSRKLPHFEIQHCFQTTLTYLLTHIHWFAQVKTNLMHIWYLCHTRRIHLFMICSTGKVQHV